MPTSQILFFIHLPQDLDLLLPILKKLKTQAELTPVIWVTDRVCKQSPRIAATLTHETIPFQTISYFAGRLGIFPELSPFSALITASESSAQPHRIAHTLTQKANRRRMKTFTLQQGFENVGLNYFDPAYGSHIAFASEKILIWGGIETLSSEISETTRKKCISVGYPKESIALSHPARNPQWKTVMAVFENLHRSCYAESYRNSFLSNLKETVAAFPQVTFLLKPHHNQRWSAIHAFSKISPAENLILIDPQKSEWEPFTSNALLAICDGAISTPSTTALDSAIAGKPVAIVGGSSSSSRYHPLKILKKTEDWSTFVKAIQDPQETIKEKQNAADFLKKNISPGSALERIHEVIRLAI